MSARRSCWWCDRGLSEQMLGALLRGVATRAYQEVLPAMAATVGVSPSSVSRQAIDASAEQLNVSEGGRQWSESDSAFAGDVLVHVGAPADRMVIILERNSAVMAQVE